MAFGHVKEQGEGGENCSIKRYVGAISDSRDLDLVGPSKPTSNWQQFVSQLVGGLSTFGQFWANYPLPRIGRPRFSHAQ